MKPISTFGASPYRVQEIQLFQGADSGSIAPLLKNSPVMQVEAGEVVANGQRARLYIVLRGALSVAADTRTSMADGSTSKVLRGESVGEQAVLDDEANQATITALEQSELLVIESELAWQLIDAANGVARNLLRMLSFRIRAANAQLRRRQKLGEFYRQLSMNDGLTGLYNRAWLNECMPQLVASAHGTGQPLSLIMLDLDHFKQFNDSHGHLQGDAALRTAAQVLTGALRPTDFAVRYGGEEMMVILPATNIQVAEVVAGRLCERMRAAVVFTDMRQALPHVTASFGVSTLAPGQDEQALIASADAALYRAKAAGRNQVGVSSVIWTRATHF